MDMALLFFSFFLFSNFFGLTGVPFTSQQTIAEKSGIQQNTTSFDPVVYIL